MRLQGESIADSPFFWENDMQGSGIGLALGSGGARGLAHIGILKVLEKNDIPVCCIAGTSIGALIGGLYASGMAVEQMEEIACDTDWLDVARIFVPKFQPGAILGGKYIRDFITALVGDTEFRDLKIPFSAIATDIMKGDEIIITKGSLAQAILASTALPGIFSPVESESRSLLVDGGLKNPLPVDVVKTMNAGFVIGVNVTTPRDLNVKKQKVKSAERIRFSAFAGTPKILKERLNEYLSRGETMINERFPFSSFMRDRQKTDKRIPSLMNTIGQSIIIMQNQILRLKMESDKPDILLEPDVSDFQWFDFNEAGNIIRQGERIIEEYIPQLLRIRDMLQSRSG